jgi:hypothetical protein
VRRCLFADRGSVLRSHLQRSRIIVLLPNHAGTTPEALVEAAHKIGLTAKLTFDDPASLSRAIHQQQPIIVYLGIPPPSSELEIHAVVVSDLTLETVTYIDPTDGKEHRQVRDIFFAHWQNAFHTTIVITRS